MRTIRTTVRLLILTLIASSLAVVTLAPAANAGASIKVLKVKGGLRGPAGFTFLPGGKLLYAERGSGQIRILNLETKHTRRFFTIAGAGMGSTVRAIVARQIINFDDSAARACP